MQQTHGFDCCQGASTAGPDASAFDASSSCVGRLCKQLERIGKHIVVLLARRIGVVLEFILLVFVFLVCVLLVHTAPTRGSLVMRYWTVATLHSTLGCASLLMQ